MSSAREQEMCVETQRRTNLIMRFFFFLQPRADDRDVRRPATGPRADELEAPRDGDVPLEMQTEFGVVVLNPTAPHVRKWKALLPPEQSPPGETRSSRGGARAAAPTRVDARALQLLRLMETALEREHAGVCAHAHTHTHLRSVSPRVRPRLGT